MMDSKALGGWLFKRVFRPAAPVVLALALAACGGGGGGGSPMNGAEPPPDPGPAPSLPPSDDPRVARLGALYERADALLLSSLHARWSLAAEGETIEDSLAEPVSCSGARCVTASGAVTTPRDLLDPSSDIDPATADADIGERGGFDTVTTAGTFETTETLPGIALSISPEVTSYGFWGEHGFAAVAVGAGPLTALIEGTAFEGDFSLARAFAVGDATGTNPAGTGSATWTGIAEAAATGTLTRLQGTATVTIADLSQPRVGVDIDVPGHSIGAPGWADMPLVNGRFASGTAGSDHLSGNFHGPAHEEAWGVFDTTGYIGAFGAKRAP